MDPDAIFCNECGMASLAGVAPAVPFPETIISAVPGSRPTPTPQPPIPQAKACPGCGNQVSPSSKFCPKCAFDMTIAASHECPGCGKLFTDADKFCRHCAFDLSKTRKASSAHFCTGCGEPFEMGDRFCNKCAADLSTSNQTVAVPSVGNATRFKAASTFGTAPHPPISFTPPPSRSAAYPAAMGDVGVQENPSGPHWISPSAAAFVVICFFLPWIEWSCFGARVPVTGVQLADRDPSFLLYPAAAILSIIVYFIFKSQRRLWMARPYILISSAVALFLLFYKVNSIPSAEVFGTRISVSDLGLKPQIGSIGTVIGFLLAMFGCIFMSRVVARSKGILFDPGWFDTQDNGRIPAGFMNKFRALKANKAAMLCYLMPIISPALAVVLVALLAVIGFIAMLAGCVIMPFALLRTPPHKENHFTRFHAFQALILFGVYFGLGILVWGFTAAQGSSPGSAGDLLIAAWLYIGSIVYLIASVVMAVKSKSGQVCKLPIIGDWSENLASGSSDSRPTFLNQ